MAKIRRIIHSVEKPVPAGFDSQYWPILIAISILFGFMMGTVLTLLSGIWLWFSLLTIPVLVLSSTIALRFVDDRRFKRSSQLALIVSLIVHLAMLLSAHHWQLFGEDNEMADTANEQKKVEKTRSRIPLVFETQNWQQSQSKKTPQPNQEKVEQRQPERERQPEPQKTPTPVDQPQRQVTQNQSQRRQQKQTVPKQSETLSKLTRSDLKAELKSGTKVSEATNNSPQKNPNKAENQPSKLTAQKSLQPQKNPADAPNPNQSNVKVTNQKSTSASQASVSRRQTNPLQPQTQNQNAKSQPRRARSTPVPNPLQNRVAKSTTKTNRSSAPAKARSALQPTKTDVAKTSRNRQTDQPTQQAPRESNAQRQVVKNPLASRRPQNQPNPKIAQATTSRSRTSNPNQIPNTTVMEAPQKVVRAPTESSQLNPRPTNSSVSRSRNVTRQPTQIQIQAPTQQMSAVTQSATRASRRPNDTLPSVTPNANPSPQPRRSNNTAAEVASNTSVESPANTTSNSQVAKSVGQPRNTTLQKSTTGTAGVGQSANVLSDAPTSAKPSLVASDSAVRRETTQTSPQDSAFRPVQSAQVRRSLADRSTPSAEMKVENSPNARFAGSANPAQLNAQSSASQIDAASNAAQGRINAAQGSSTIDTGATKLVSESGQSRASGGGQPDVDQEIRISSSQRSRNGQVSNASLAANLQANVPQAPADLGGGRPSETTPDPNSTSLAKTVAGGGKQALAGPTSAAVSGPSEEASTAPSKSSATLAKAAPNEAAEGDTLEGGGDPNVNSTLRRTRSQLAGANANTKVTFSGENYTSRDEGSDGSDAAAGARLVGGSDTTIESQTSSGVSGSGETAGSQMLAAGSEKSESSALGGGLTRKSADDDAALGGDQGSTGRQVASSRRQGGASGPKPNATVELPSGGGGGLSEPGAGTSESKLAGLAGSGDIGIKKRDQTGGQLVQLDLEQGPGGLGSKVAAETGISSRRARKDSTSIQLKVDTRFQRKDAGGNPKINTTAVFSKGAFKGRDKGKSGATGPSTEPAIEMGLSWLAKQQRAPGNWSLTSSGISDEEAELVAYDTPTAATGLALLSFQGAGYNHKEYKYADVVNKGVQWLISNQQEDGCLYVETNDTSNDVCRLYSHGIAAIALCEAYGMTNDPEVRKAAQKALDYISSSQDKTYGGWRYSPGAQSDTSVTGWMVMALKSGKLAGLEVDQETLTLVDRWLGFAADRDSQFKFRYNPNAKNTAQYPDREVKGKTPTACMTSVGLLLRLYSGWNRTDERMIQGAKELLKSMPSDSSIEFRNTYYWYYATQVLKHVGGGMWETWYKESLYPLLINSQEKTGPLQGSWDPIKPVPDRWGYFSGRLYVTTMNLLTLEVKWRLLPLYDDTVK